MTHTHTLSLSFSHFLSLSLSLSLARSLALALALSHTQLPMKQQQGLTYTSRYHMSRALVVLGAVLGVLGGSVSYLEVSLPPFSSLLSFSLPPLLKKALALAR
jgi:hypothetical protein